MQMRAFTDGQNVPDFTKNGSVEDSNKQGALSRNTRSRSKRDAIDRSTSGHGGTGTDDDNRRSGLSNASHGRLQMGGKKNALELIKKVRHGRG